MMTIRPRRAGLKILFSSGLIASTSFSGSGAVSGSAQSFISVSVAALDVMELFYQVFDKGMLEDGEGREIDFKNTVILLTSNAATDTLMKLCADPETAPEPEKLVEAIKPELNKIFKPALLGRMVIVPYYPISDKVMREIIKLQLGRIGSRLKENHGASFSFDDSVINEILGRCKAVSY